MTAIDVIVPTYNRPDLLERAVRSLLAARVPPGVSRRVLVVDNNSAPSTPEVIARLVAAAPAEVIALTEHRQGRSNALNAGIRASGAELIGIIDDDETVALPWFEVACEWMTRPGVGFIGGPVRGTWEITPPAWLPPDRPGAVGDFNPGPIPLQFGAQFPGILVGGNCVIRRSVFDQVGLYSTELGRTNVGLLCGEDDEFYQRLLAAGIEGWYVPELEIFHHIPRERATRKYFRSWSFWHGVSRGRMTASVAEPVRYLAGIPRYHFGKAIGGLRSMLRGDSANRFSGELEWWALAGILYGRYTRRASRRRD